MRIPSPQPRPPRSAAIRHACLALTLPALAACGDDPTAAESAERRALETLRASTSSFQSLAVAQEAGYTLLFLDACMADDGGQNRGAMGFHWVNPDLLDGAVDVAAPEALLYEPGPNGERTLVGVEYVIPKAAWSGTEPPRLFGRDFTLNGFDLWALHVWVWKDNPSGRYADWNPRVSCANAPAASPRAHH